MDSIQGEIDCLKDEAGFVRLADHGVIELTGEDRLKFLHNFCTADIKQLSPGDQTEAFILNGKGKSLCFANVLATEDRLLLVFNLAATAPDVIAHLDMYLIREDVELSDRSNELSVWFVAGEQANGRLSEMESNNLTVAPAEIAGDGWLVVGRSADAEAIEASLAGKQIEACGAESLLVRRVQSVTPWNGIEVTVNNLPQELDRDEKSISFNKGCYLGQETVARLDALGRVNWILRGFVCPEGVEPAAGCKLEVEGKAAARITSVAYSDADGRWLAVGFAKRGFEKSGTVVDGWTVR